MDREDEIQEFSDEVFETLLHPDMREQANESDFPHDVILTCALEISVRLLAARHGEPKLSQVLHTMASTLTSNPGGIHSILPGWVAQRLRLLR